MPKYSVIIAAVLVISLVIYAAVEYGDIAPEQVKVEVEIPAPKPNKTPRCRVPSEVEAVPKCVSGSEEKLEKPFVIPPTKKLEEGSSKKFKAEYNFNN